VIDVDNLGFGSGALGDVVGVVGGGQAGADVEELADASLGGQLVPASIRNSRAARAISGMDGMTKGPGRPARDRWQKLSLPMTYGLVRPRKV
jgi:hypothetical protein